MPLLRRMQREEPRKGQRRLARNLPVAPCGVLHPVHTLDPCTMPRRTHRQPGHGNLNAVASNSRGQPCRIHLGSIITLRLAICNMNFNVTSPMVRSCAGSDRKHGGVGAVASQRVATWGWQWDTDVDWPWLTDGHGLPWVEPLSQTLQPTRDAICACDRPSAILQQTDTLA